jgi:hypothetical protein
MKKRFAVVLFRIALVTAKLAARLAADDAAARAEHIRTTVAIADFPPSVADELVRRGIAPGVVAGMFAHGAELPRQ